jgi:hypothetical protein
MGSLSGTGSPVAVDSDLEWYWVAATYKAVHLGRVRRRHLWERTVFLIRAASAEEATVIAQRVACDKEHEYLAVKGDTVRWVLQEVEDIQPLHDQVFEDGTEVFWQFFDRIDRCVRSTCG